MTAWQPTDEQEVVLHYERQVAELRLRVETLERQTNLLGEKVERVLRDVTCRLDDMSQRFEEKMDSLHRELGRLVPVWVVPLVATLSATIGALGGALALALRR